MKKQITVYFKEVTFDLEIPKEIEDDEEEIEQYINDYVYIDNIDEINEQTYIDYIDNIDEINEQTYIDYRED